MKIYKIAQGVPYFDIGSVLSYIIDGNNKITEVNSHMQGIIDLYHLEDDIVNNFKKMMGKRKKIDWDEDWSGVEDYVELFMEENNIFSIVVDIKEKQVYVRPLRGKSPSNSQMKEISDWAIEHGWNENVIVDVVVAKNRFKIYKIAKEKSKIVEKDDDYEERTLDLTDESNWNYIAFGDGEWKLKSNPDYVISGKEGNGIYRIYYKNRPIYKAKSFQEAAQLVTPHYEATLYGNKIQEPNYEEDTVEDMVNYLGYTNDFRKAGYIREDGSLIDLSGGDRYRVLDHREIGGTTGMQEFVAAGNIRMSVTGNYESAFLDIKKRPTSQQIEIISKLSDLIKEYVYIELQNGLGKLNDQGQYYLNTDNKFEKQYSRGEKVNILEDIEEYFKDGKIYESPLKRFLQNNNWYKKASENSLPSQFNATYGSCMSAAEILTKNLLSKEINDFKAIEGYITFKGVEWNEKHTWIELSNGLIVDPTKTQWGLDVDKMIYMEENRKEYTPEQYLKLCEKFSVDPQKYLTKN